MGGGGGGISFTMMAFTWQDSFDMMNSNESIKLLIMIPLLLYKTSTGEISFPSIWTRFSSITIKLILQVYMKIFEGRANANSNKYSHNIVLCLSNKW